MIPDHIFNQHHSHEIAIDQNPISKKGYPTRHLGAMRCVTCQKHLKWMSGPELVALGYITNQELDDYQEIQKQKNTITCEDPWL